MKGEQRRVGGFGEVGRAGEVTLPNSSHALWQAPSTRLTHFARASSLHARPASLARPASPKPPTLRCSPFKPLAPRTVGLASPSHPPGPSLPLGVRGAPPRQGRPQSKLASTTKTSPTSPDSPTRVSAPAPSPAARSDVRSRGARAPRLVGRNRVPPHLRPRPPLRSQERGSRVPGRERHFRVAESHSWGSLEHRAMTTAANTFSPRYYACT